jgi:hypothetical protein
MNHSPYGTDLAPSDSHLYRPHQKHLAGRQFAVDGDMKQAITSWMQTLGTRFFCTGMQTLVPQWGKCLNINGHYMKV